MSCGGVKVAENPCVRGSCFTKEPLGQALGGTQRVRSGDHFDAQLAPYTVAKCDLPWPDAHG